MCHTRSIFHRTFARPSVPRVRLLLSLLLAAASPLPASEVAQAREQTFRFPIRRELHVAGAKGAAPATYTREKIGDSMVSVLGVTGRVVLSRRAMWADEGGQLFVEATIPESMAARAHDLDVYVEDPRRGRQDQTPSLSLRGSMHYEPARKPYEEPGTQTVDEEVYKPAETEAKAHRISRTFVFPDLLPGPVLTEVHLRGAHTKDWQEIVTEPVDVPADSRLRLGFGLDGADPRNQVPVDLVVEARRVGGGDDSAKNPAVVTVLSRRVAGPSRWQDVDQDLAKLAGRKYRFVFRSRPASGDAASAPGVVWGAPSVEFDETRRSYPVILVVSLDSLRTSSVGLYYQSAATPFLSGFFGSQGAVMMQATTQAVTTLPAHMTLMTGLNPSVHGVVDETRSLAPSIPTLAEALRKDGWHTAAFTEGGALAREFGFKRGFDLYDEGTAAEVSPQSADALERAARWLEQYSGEPLFLFVHTYRTRPVHVGENASDDAVRQRQIAAYVEQVRAADRSLATLVAATKGRVVEDKSLYVVTSGHGEEFYEHGAAGHGTQLYEESSRVPLLLRGGRVESGGRYDAEVGLIDLAPTILDLAGAGVPSGMQGKSFYRLVHGGKSLEVPARFAEAHRPLRLLRDGSLMEWGAPSYSVREGSHKVIFHAGRQGRMEAYDLTADRRERSDLAALSRPPAWVARLANMVRGYPALAAKTARQRPARVELTPANRSRLESLGYAH
ncbi:MAG: sulfatase [Deltaproteobacteria bacterium]|nr:sulfatase [Deltaproteobacteria bacterium]